MTEESKNTESETPKKPKRNFAFPNRPPRETFMPPETMGAMKRPNPFHMSLDELIQYRQTGIKPRLVIDDKMIYKMATMGISIKNICGIFEITEETFCNTPAFLSAHQSGRGLAGSRLRTVLLRAVEEDNNMQVAMYLDKIMSGEQEKQRIDLTLTDDRPLKNISDDELIIAIETKVVPNESKNDSNLD